jgi:lysophospholipase L1-like esterase
MSGWCPIAPAEAKVRWFFIINSMSSRQIPPRQGRQCYRALLLAGSLIVAVSAFTLSTLTGIIGLVVFITAERLSRPPHNGPHEFVKQDNKRGKRDEDERVLVCLGDSLTHGACSANWVDDVVPSLTKQLQKDIKTKTTLTVVNAGQNGICTHTVLHEKVNHVVACRPDYIFIMIGSNDAMAIYREDWASERMHAWNLTEKPTEDVLIRNLTDTVKALLDQTTAVIAIATLPPFGENVNSASNKIIQSINSRIKTLEYHFLGEIKSDSRETTRVSVIDVNSALWAEINSQRSRKNTKPTHSIDMFLPYATVMGILHCVFGLSWNALTRLSGNVVLCESLHLNEDGGSILRNEVVHWLMDKLT